MIISWYLSHYQPSDLFSCFLDNCALRELIPLSALDDIIQNQHSAIVARFEYEDILVFAFLVVKDIVDLEGHGLTRPHV